MFHSKKWMQSVELETVFIPLKDTMTRLYDSKYILIRNIDDDGTYDPSLRDSNKSSSC